MFARLTSLSAVFEILDCSLLKMLSSCCSWTLPFSLTGHLCLLFFAGSSHSPELRAQTLPSSLSSHASLAISSSLMALNAIHVLKNLQMCFSRPDFSANLQTCKSICCLDISPWMSTVGISNSTRPRHNSLNRLPSFIKKQLHFFSCAGPKLWSHI